MTIRIGTSSIESNYSPASAPMPCRRSAWLLRHGLATASFLAISLASMTAAAAPIPCGEAISGYIADGAHALEVMGTRVTIRGDYGHVGFTMSETFEIEATPLHTSASVAHRMFYANSNSSNTAFTGNYSTVFTDRGNTDEDLSQFWVYASGAFYLRSITSSGSWQLVDDATCFQSSSGQVVVRGTTSQNVFWTFLLRPWWLY